MKLPVLKGSPKQVAWGEKIRAERLRVWAGSSPEKFAGIAGQVTAITDAGWWISYRDRDIVTLCNHLREDVDLRKLQLDQWRQQEKSREQRERSSTRAYLKKELQQEERSRNAAGTAGMTPLPAGGGIMKWESPARDIRTGELCRDPDLPF